MPNKAKAILGSITNVNTEAIANASNGVGIMGSGVAGAIAKAAGANFRKEVKDICDKSGNYKAGNCFISPSGDLEKVGIKHVYHAVTMDYPGGHTSLEIVENAMKDTLDKAIQNGINSIAFPGLGTGIGGLSTMQVSYVMAQVAKRYEDKIEITVVDIDSNFVELVNYWLEKVKP